MPICTDTKNELLRQIVSLSQTTFVPERIDLRPGCLDSNWELYVKFLKVLNIITESP